MRGSLLQTAQGQASVALAGVLLLACAAGWNTYAGTREHARDRAVLAIIAHQRHLAHTLSLGDTATPQTLLGQLAAGDATFQLLAASATTPGNATPELRAKLDAAREAWIAFRHAVTSPSEHGRQKHYIGLLQHLNAVTSSHEEHLDAAVRAEAARQALILGGAAPLLAWAFLVISRATAPPSREDEPLPHQVSLRARQAPARFEWHQDAEDGTSLGSRPALAERAEREAVVGNFVHELRAYAADFRQMSGVAVELALDEWAAAAVPPSARTQALTIAREAIADTRRDARPTRISVALWQDPGGVWLAVADDGVRKTHPGMAITRARAERIGGELCVSAQPDGGTMVLARLPLDEPQPCSSAPIPTARRAW